MFMVVVIFLPGGVTEGFQKIQNRFTKSKEQEKLKQGDE
jgi:hypothetical protein